MAEDDLPGLLVRLQAYSTQTADGGVQLDLKGMAIDLIAMIKGEGHSKEMFLQMLGELWDDVTVEIDIPNKNKN
jgi:hypothetical protein